eukprot:TRINITY_DN26279_c0_g1_i2.p1 TRINITY_DN26279_c0_g1~~TRINITY_DN26279_c0_g1_i2.p1  ORF type:complete len:233 (+),score=67.37 TRINITY_DN26279_c0_g1_i2:131-829(+)
MIRRPPRSTLSSSSAASDVYKRQGENENGWHLDKTDRGLEYYTRAGTADGMIEFKGKLGMKVGSVDCLFYILDANQRRHYDDDFDFKDFRIVELLDDHTMLTNVGFAMPGPFLSNRGFVTVNFHTVDPETKDIIYMMYSVEDPEEIKRARPNPKAVMGQVHAVYLIQPTPEGCTVTFWSVANPRLTGGSLIANTVSKMKPAQLGKICKQLQDPASSKQRVADARENYMNVWT